MLNRAVTNLNLLGLVDARGGCGPVVGDLLGGRGIPAAVPQPGVPLVRQSGQIYKYEELSRNENAFNAPSAKWNLVY